MLNILDESPSLSHEQDEFSARAIAQLKITAQWTRFISITGLIIFGVVILGSLSTLVSTMFTVGAQLSGADLWHLIKFLSPLLIYQIFPVYFFYMSYLLNNYSKELRLVVASSSTNDYKKALPIWNRFWSAAVNLIIFFIATLIILLVFSAL